jgi:hypothetical protein
LRREIWISDFPTDEIDYSGLHPSILAVETGHRLEGDPYDLGRKIVDIIPKDEQRAVVKLLVLIAINAKSRSSAYSAYRAEHESYKNAELEPLLDAFIDKHPYLADSICSDQGIRLMSLDSQITTHIINRFVAEGKPILSIHDSYIVQQENRKLLREAMADACIEVVGADIEAESRVDKEREKATSIKEPMYGAYGYFIDEVMGIEVVGCKEYMDRYGIWLDKNDTETCCREIETQ